MNPKKTGLRADILHIDEDTFVNGKWLPGRWMNEGRHLRIPGGISDTDGKIV